MLDLLNDELNLNLLKRIVAGNGVEVNVSALSNILGKHRNTVRDRVDGLFVHNVIDKPKYSFSWLLKELPLMTISKSNFLRDEKTKHFIEYDDHIFAAFFFKEEEYNTLTISFHRDITSHQQWCENVVKEEIIPKREEGYSLEVIHLGTGCFVKYDPSASIEVIEQNIDEKRQRHIGGYEMDKLSMDILKLLLCGKGIRTNENFLANELNVNRRTVERRIDTLLKERVVEKPVCSFPRLIIPPDYILVLSLLHITRQQEAVLGALKNDSHVSLIIKAVTGSGKYNFVAFSSFYNIEDHLEWQEELDQRFPSCLGAIKNTYLSPAMTFSISPEYVSTCIIKNRLKQIHGKELMGRMKR